MEYIYKNYWSDNSFIYTLLKYVKFIHNHVNRKIHLN